jgi:hypothetical protein
MQGRAASGASRSASTWASSISGAAGTTARAPRVPWAVSAVATAHPRAPAAASASRSARHWLLEGLQPDPGGQDAFHPKSTVRLAAPWMACTKVDALPDQPVLFRFGLWQTERLGASFG